MPGNIPHFVAADWGTSNLRLWLMGADGAVLGETRSEEGLTRVTDGNFAGVLEQKLIALGAPASLPVAICGMAGSRQGWVEAPYVKTPAALDMVLTQAMSAPHPTRDIRILPGISHNDPTTPSVMRGEETQLLGLPSHQGDQIVCMPGTHCKWVRLQGRAVIAFETYLTGELYHLFSTASLLRHSVDPEARIMPGDPAFLKACAEMIADPAQMTARLFAIRAAGLLQGVEAGRASAMLSGVLIGVEIGAARQKFASDKVTLVRSGRLGQLYEAALSLAGVTVVSADAEETVRTGLRAAALSFWPVAGEKP